MKTKSEWKSRVYHFNNISLNLLNSSFCTKNDESNINIYGSKRRVNEFWEWKICVKYKSTLQ